MRVHVSRDCGAHGQCYWINPELFPLDDDGYSAVEDALVPEERAGGRAGGRKPPARPPRSRSQAS